MIGMKVEDHLDEATTFISWKSRVVIFEENDLLKLVNEKVPELNVEEDKSHWRKSDARARRILVDWIRDDLVPQISQKKMTREMFKTLKGWWFLMAKPDLYGQRRSNAFHYTPLVVDGGSPKYYWAPTNTLVVHHGPLRVYNGRHFKAIRDRS